MSDFFEWDPKRLFLDVPAMDSEHQGLIAAMNTLHDLYEANAPADRIGAALGKLVDLTVKHFAHEEAYLERISYPGLRVHAGVHRQLLDRLRGFQEAWGRDHKLTPEFFAFLKMWLSAHIAGIDMKYSRHVHQAASA
jgi:hemerythrin